MITHGSALRVRGVSLDREEGDIDLVTDQVNLAYFRALGWLAAREHRYYDNDLPDKIRFTRSPDGKFDAFGHDFVPELYREIGRGRIYPKELFARHDARFDQDEATGIWVASIPFVIATKRGTGRPKDIRDIEQAEQYLRQSS